MAQKRRRDSSSGARQLGLEVEWRVLEALNNNGFQARHSEPEEDLHQGWDVEFQLGGFTVRVDLTISRGRLRQKQDSDQVCNGYVVAVLVDPGWSEEELFREVLRQVVHSLPKGRAEYILRKITR